MAPEIIDEEQYDRSVDWWALGIVLYEMVSGKLPFYSSEDHFLLFKMILQQNPEMSNLQHVSEPCRHLITRLLQKDPALRIGSHEDDGKCIMQHPWFGHQSKHNFDADLKYFKDEFTRDDCSLTPDHLMNIEVL